jgi:hypothetical protein
MKRIFLAVILLALMSCDAVYAANSVSAFVFSITSSATTATSNLRVTPTGPKEAPRTYGGMDIVQTFLWGPNQTQNLFLTKTKTVDMSFYLCAWIQVDQATNIKVNGETAYMTLAADYDGVICVK